jgi:hypothetical protein
MISIPGFFKACRVFMGVGQGKKQILSGFGYGLSAMLFLWMTFKFFMAGKLRNVSQKQAELKRLLLLAGPAAILISPQPLFYDFGICTLSYAGYLKLENDGSKTFFIILVLLVTFSMQYFLYFYINPLFFAVLAIFLYLANSPDQVGSKISQ